MHQSLNYAPKFFFWGEGSIRLRTFSPISPTKSLHRVLLACREKNLVQNFWHGHYRWLFWKWANQDWFKKLTFNFGGWQCNFSMQEYLLSYCTYYVNNLPIQGNLYERGELKKLLSAFEKSYMPQKPPDMDVTECA